MKCLRAIMRVTRSERISNIAIRKSLNVVVTIEEAIVKRQIRWFSHVARSRYMINASYKFNFTNPRSRGHPLNRWSDGIRESSGVPLLTLETRAENREAYINQVYTRIRVFCKGTPSPAQLSQVSQIIIYYIIYNMIYLQPIGHTGLC